MIRPRAHGFILFSVVILVMLAGSMLALYTHLTQNLAAQTKVLHHAAWQRTLVHSGENWLQHNAPALQTKFPGPCLELETASLVPETSVADFSLMLQKDSDEQVTVVCRRLTAPD